jgi:hypothetical protein
MNRLREWLPKRAIIVPPSAEHNEILRSLPRGILESPMETFFKLVKHVYYKYVFLGKLLPNLRVSADLESKRGSTPLWQLSQYFSAESGGELAVNGYDEYLRQWRRPGFRYENTEPYYVIPHRNRDIMSLGWQWRTRPERPTVLSDLSTHDFLDVILYNKDVKLVVDRLNMFFESDPLMEIRVRDNASYTGTVVFISNDVKRAASIGSWIRRVREPRTNIFVVDPVIYLLGRLGELTDRLPNPGVIEDAGSLNWSSRNMGSSNLYLVECNEIEVTTTRYPWCHKVGISGFRISAAPFRSHRVIDTEVPYVDQLIIEDERATENFLSLVHLDGASGEAPPDYNL